MYLKTKLVKSWYKYKSSWVLHVQVIPSVFFLFEKKKEMLCQIYKKLRYGHFL